VAISWPDTQRVASGAACVRLRQSLQVASVKTLCSSCVAFGRQAYFSFSEGQFQFWRISIQGVVICQRVLKGLEHSLAILERTIDRIPARLIVIEVMEYQQHHTAAYCMLIPVGLGLPFAERGGLPNLLAGIQSGGGPADHGTAQGQGLCALRKGSRGGWTLAKPLADLLLPVTRTATHKSEV
jgi:hypothetical protein